jgi:inositol hexakisphosphate/diphosphoinositol-pentakisphosphate kinase
VNDARFFKLFKKYSGVQQREIKLKRPAQLMEILELIRAILNENLAKRVDVSEQMSQLKQEDQRYKEMETAMEKANEQIKTWDQMRCVLEMYGHFSGINRKVQLKYLKPKELENFSEDDSSVPELLLILKWGK